MYRPKLYWIKLEFKKNLKMVFATLSPISIKILFVNARFFSLAECTIHSKHLVPYTKTKQKKYAQKTYRTKLFYNKH